MYVVCQMLLTFDFVPVILLSCHVCLQLRFVICLINEDMDYDHMH